MVYPAVFQSLIWICQMTIGLQSQHHEVTHIISKMCVVRQSTTLIPCRYSHPISERLHTGEWLYQRSPVSLDPVFKGRVEFTPSVGDEGGNCSLLLRDVRNSDAGVFHFAFRTDVSAQNWTNSSGISLEVTGAEVEVIYPPDVLTEGDLLVFICGSCIPSIVLPTYIWRKDGRVFHQDYGSNQLDLDPVRLEDEGRFSCTLSGHEGLNSSSVTINVRPGHSPENTSLSIIPSGEIVEGDMVKLTCKSVARPPVQNYSWFKDNQISSVGSEQTHIIFSFHSGLVGWFYCMAQNKYGSQRSDSVSLSVKEGNGSVVNVVAVGVILAVVVTSVILMFAIVMFLRRKKRTSEGQNSKGQQQHHRKIESCDGIYMTLDPRALSSDYDTLDNMKISREN